MWNDLRSVIQRLWGRSDGADAPPTIDSEEHEPAMYVSPLASLPMRDLYLARVRESGFELESLTPEIALQDVLAWYAAERFQGCDVSESGDMLLYQWGNSYPDGAFYVDITRQLITGEGEDDDIFQLSLTLTFDVPAESLGIESGNRWCETPAEIEEFRAFVEASDAFKATRHRQPVRVELDYGCAG